MTENKQASIFGSIASKEPFEINKENSRIQEPSIPAKPFSFGSSTIFSAPPFASSSSSATSSSSVAPPRPSVPVQPIDVQSSSKSSPFLASSQPTIQLQSKNLFTNLQQSVSTQKPSALSAGPSTPAGTPATVSASNFTTRQKNDLQTALQSKPVEERQVTEGKS